jgi:pyruvyltransferase
MITRAAECPVFYWQPPRSLRRPFPWHNVGDRLALDLVQRILARRGLTLAQYTGGARRVLTVGSVLHFASDGDVVWGTGVNAKAQAGPLKARRLDVRAVRGPLTASRLEELGIDVPAVYGDPGILVSRIFPHERKPRWDYVVVPHFRERWLRFFPHPTLSPAQAPEPFLRKLVRARRVISSSLHGLVLAESYGIPAVWLENRSGEAPFKYHDYYLGTGRQPPRPARRGGCAATRGAAAARGGSEGAVAGGVPLGLVGVGVFAARATGLNNPHIPAVRLDVQKKGPDYASRVIGPFENTPGSDLLSHTPADAVPSAVAGLPSVFGMGTGVTLPL